jgi:hypothetical protein
MSTENIRELVKEKYGQAAVQVTQGGRATCGNTCSGKDPITSDLYRPDETGALPAEAVAASLRLTVAPCAVIRARRKPFAIAFLGCIVDQFCTTVPTVTHDMDDLITFRTAPHFATGRMPNRPPFLHPVG